MARVMRFEDWGTVDYEAALGRQREIFEEPGEGVIVFCEHPPVFTVGRNGDEANVLAADAVLRRGARVVRTDRGGDVTFHGPGQLVCYPILRLGTMGLREYIRRLEQAVIDTLAEFGIEGARSEKGAGVWVSGGKICAVGVRASRGVVMHGLALNVTTDLEWFRMINPCGMAGEAVSSIAAEMKGRSLASFHSLRDDGEAERLMGEVKEVLKEKLLKNINYANRKAMGDPAAG